MVIGKILAPSPPPLVFRHVHVVKFIYYLICVYTALEDISLLQGIMEKSKAR